VPSARPLYRARQVLLALFPRVGDSDLSEARALLSAGEYDLFRRMELCDQRHGIEVMRRLRGLGVDDRDALAAALLHDCGKGWVPVWLRIEYVRKPEKVMAMSRKAVPPDASRSGRNNGARTLEERTIEMAAYRLVHHAHLGAERARAAGAGAVTVRLISGIVSSEEERRLLALLEAADDAS
jgi:hypothetical protein